MTDINAELPLDDTIAALIFQVVALKAELHIQKAFLNSLATVFHPELEGQVAKTIETEFPEIFHLELSQSFPQISDGLRDRILWQIEKAED